MNAAIGWQTKLALETRGLAFIEFEIVNPGPRQRVIAKAARRDGQRDVRIEAMGHTAGDAEDKLVRLVRAN